MTPQVRRFHERASAALGQLSELVLPGAKLTLLVRRPEAPDGSQDIVVTDDEIVEVIRALEIRKHEEIRQAAKPAPDEHPPYVTITSGMRGYFAVLVVWNPEGFYEPEQSGIGSYRTSKAAIPEARSWAESEGVQFKGPTT